MMSMNRFIPNRPVKVFESCFSAGRRLSHGLMELIYPPACAACGMVIADSGDFLCLDCWQNLRENLPGNYCRVCGHDIGEFSLIDGRCHNCQNRRPAISHITRVGPYGKVLRQLILSFKFGRQSQMDKFLGSLLADAFLGDEHLADVDLLVPIPLHWRRRWSRTYNQAELLAKVVARQLKKQGRTIPVNCDLLRVRHTEPQTSLARSHRLLNLRGAFAARVDADYSGKHICLIDDVTTTGTTLRVAGRALKKAGVARVSAAVLAVAAND